jgi:hypothetical protein
MITTRWEAGNCADDSAAVATTLIYQMHATGVNATAPVAEQLGIFPLCCGFLRVRRSGGSDPSAAEGSDRAMSLATLARVHDNRVGTLSRDWRERRRLSRARPSADMGAPPGRAARAPIAPAQRAVAAAGYAPQYRARSLEHPEMKPIRDGLGPVLSGDEPYPAITVDRGWNPSDQAIVCALS